MTWMFHVKTTIDKIILTFTFPRLDKNVSLLRHHLLKSPFIVHPKSCAYEVLCWVVGRFCCPIDPDRIEEFDPFSVPCLDEVFESEEACRWYVCALRIVKKYNENVGWFRDKFLSALKKECCIEDGKARGEEANESELFWRVCSCTEVLVAYGNTQLAILSLNQVRESQVNLNKECVWKEGENG